MNSNTPRKLLSCVTQKNYVQNIIFQTPCGVCVVSDSTNGPKPQSQMHLKKKGLPSDSEDKKS